MNTTEAPYDLRGFSPEMFGIVESWAAPQDAYIGELLWKGCATCTSWIVSRDGVDMAAGYICFDLVSGTTLIGGLISNPLLECKDRRDSLDYLLLLFTCRAIEEGLPLENVTAITKTDRLSLGAIQSAERALALGGRA